jgi:hypothetical protein
MSSSRPAFLLFKMPDGTLEGVPQEVDPGSFAALGALEVQHIERWLVNAPAVLGEELLVITNQFAGFDNTRERSDILALDRAGKLVVIELKRDSSGSRQDLQALRYAAYSATLGHDDLAELYAVHQARKGNPMSKEDAVTALEEHVEQGELAELSEDIRPRIILVAKSFQVEVTATCLWLREAWGIDIACVQLVPYQVDDQVLLASSVLIPLPEASAYTVKRERKHQQAHDEEVERHQLRRRFWSGLIEQASERGTSHGNLSPPRYGWLGAGSGTRGIAFNYVIWQHTGAAEVYIDRGDRAENKRIYDELASDREAIEAITGELEWSRLDAKRAARIRTPMVECGWRDDAAGWPDAQRAMIDMMDRLEEALRPRIAKLSLK